ncbi:hypothetical protein DAH66_08150 [Sphingomonas koreensis]|uniref:Histidine phosphatase family protein n=1 Tax=Sphingomonas koreensis TaxID=93064 RepID=A0A430G5N2_9SPHN|nr:hypothetical protein [Sphingomonas koreensis]RSY87580.1 hypothetical protein DAH66_08150 [Sphingomonas koreensis]
MNAYDVKQQNRRSVVSIFMVRHATSEGNPQQPNGYRVELPRPHDAIGVVLRDSYLRDIDLPEDMALLLRRMNGVHNGNADNDKG